MSYAKLGRRADHRRAVLRNLANALLAHERIETTETKARELAPVVEKMITVARQGNLHARRQALAFLNNEDVVKKLFENIAPRYAGRQGGYTRVIRLGSRRGDAAPMAIIELV